MQLQFNIGDQLGLVDLRNPVDLSLSMGPGGDNPGAFFIEPSNFAPIRVGDFVGRVAEGGSANCEIINFCAHGNGTHTECVGHITADRIVITDVLQEFWYSAQLITVDLYQGECIRLADIKALNLEYTQALVVRSAPNHPSKKNRNWSGASAPYFEPEALAYLRDAGYLHLLTDFPSVDPEEDEGRLSAHHEWWGVPQRILGGNVETVTPLHNRYRATITELIYVPSEVEDGLYALNLHIPNMRTDAVPSRPLLYPWNKV